jgi:hypothetical protein
MIPGPGTGCALVRCDHEAILCTPDEYCRDTVFPVIKSEVLQSGTGIDSLTNVSKLPVLEDKEVVLLTENSQLINEILIEVLNDIHMCLELPVSVQSDLYEEGSLCLDDAHERTANVDDAKEVCLCGYVYANTEIRLLALNDLK